MVNRYEGDSGAYLTTELFEEIIVKLFCIVYCYRLGTPNRQMMFFQKHFLIVAEVILVRGSASIHFVKYSTATTAYL
jgi:hypothetical protein